jgi:hypothetical protein
LPSLRVSIHTAFFIDSSVPNNCFNFPAFAVVGLLAIKKAFVATPLLVPLIVITIIFNAYVRQQHFRVADNLPSRECVKADLRNGPDFDLSFTKEAYLQVELQEKLKYPENLTIERAIEFGILDVNAVENR